MSAAGATIGRIHINPCWLPGDVDGPARKGGAFLYPRDCSVRYNRWMASDERADAERELTRYRQTVEGRDGMIRRTHAAGLTKHRIHILSGIARTTIDRILNRKEKA